MIPLHLQVPDVENPEFFKAMDRLVELNTKVLAIGKQDIPSPLKALLRAPLIISMVSEILAVFIAKPLDSGSVDIAQQDGQLGY